MSERRTRGSSVESGLRGPEALRMFLRALRDEGFLLMYPGQHPRTDSHRLVLRLVELRIIRDADALEFEKHVLNFLDDAPMEPATSETGIGLPGLPR